MATGRADQAAEQLDLFSGARVAPANDTPGPFGPASGWAPLDPSRLSDAALIAALPRARQIDAAPLVNEAVRRGLRDAVPALEQLCRRFAGFGRSHEITEQVAALRGLAVLGGGTAEEAVSRLIVAGAVTGPGVRVALKAAAALRCRLPVDRIAAFLRDDDPGVRAAACQCARGGTEVVAALIELLSDLHEPVTRAAAVALGQLGRREAAPLLIRMLRTAPSPDVVGALAAIAEEDDWVLLGQTARQRPDLAPVVLEMLEDSGAPRALAVANGLRRLLGTSLASTGSPDN